MGFDFCCLCQLWATKISRRMRRVRTIRTMPLADALEGEIVEIQLDVPRGLYFCGCPEKEKRKKRKKNHVVRDCRRTGTHGAYRLHSIYTGSA